MKIYFAGAHAVGKTTLARYVSERYNLPMITEVARSILSEKELQLDTLRVNLDVVDEYQTEIFYRQIQEENKHQSFVSDRSFDCLAYASEHSRVLHRLMASPEFEKYVDALREPDVRVFFVRPSKATLKEDGIREPLNWDGIIAIDACVKFLFQFLNLDHFQISMSSMQERVNFINSIMRLK